MPIEPLTSVDEIVALLGACNLPVADITAAQSPLFFGIHRNGVLAGVVGLELYERYGLLRSLVVRPEFRHHGVARMLVVHAESVAAAQHIATLYLLTTTAEAFFLNLGYRPASRDDAPTAIRNTAQFADLCPTSSAFLAKSL